MQSPLDKLLLLFAELLTVNLVLPSAIVGGIPILIFIGFIVQKLFVGVSVVESKRFKLVGIK